MKFVKKEVRDNSFQKVNQCSFTLLNQIGEQDSRPDGVFIKG